MDDEERGADDDLPRARGQETSNRSGSGWPWSRLLLGCAIAGPALAFGGVHPVTVIAFVVVTTVLWIRLGLRSRASLQIPVWAGLGAAAATLTFFQWLPIPGLREVAAPGIDQLIDHALVGTGVTPRPGLSPTPADTGLEAARLWALTALFIAAAQLSWRVTAAIVAALGTAVALVGFGHEAIGLHQIYGFYTPHHMNPADSAALLGTFVNPNHQSGLLLLGIFSAVALAADQHAHAMVTADPSRVDRYSDRFLAATAGVAIQVPALILSLSRAAILVLAVFGPLALVLARRRQQTGRKPRRRRAERISATRLMITAGALGLLALVVQHGAWRELATLSSLADSTREAGHKFGLAMDALQLWSLAPVFGIGRGAFVDLFPRVRTDPTHVLATHLECAPIAMLVEWGPWFGGALCLAFAIWWGQAMLQRDRGSDRSARRIVLLGLFAVALQNTADFAFEFLGVAAPAVALAGALCGGRRMTWRRLVVVWIGAASLAAATALASDSLAHSQPRREQVNAAVLAGELPASQVLPRRPLDGRLHGLLARAAAQAGDWPTAATRAEVATDLQPGNVDAWLLLSAAQDQLGEIEAARRSLATGLELLHEAPDDTLIGWLLARFPDPGDFARLTPDGERPWRLLVDAMAKVAPRHAEALAAARARQRVTDPEPLRVQHALALRARNPALALHYARLLVQLAPDDVRSHLALAQALRAFAPPRLDEARIVLERALIDERHRDLAERGLLEQELIEVLVELGTDAALTSARGLAADLLTRPATRELRRQRERLVHRLRDAGG